MQPHSLTGLDDAHGKSVTLQALSRASAWLPQIERALKSLQKLNSSTLSSSDRNIDIAALSSLRLDKTVCEEQIITRMRLQAACMSFAKEFADFEEIGGQSKERQVMQSITTGACVPIQRVEKNFGKFVKQKMTSFEGESDLQKQLGTAVRIGTKLRVLDSLGETIGLRNGGLSLILGFDCSRINRMTYSSLRYVASELSANEQSLATFSEFDGSFGAFWAAYLERYHADNISGLYVDGKRKNQSGNIHQVDEKTLVADSPDHIYFAPQLQTPIAPRSRTAGGIEDFIISSNDVKASCCTPPAPSPSVRQGNRHCRNATSDTQFCHQDKPTVTSIWDGDRVCHSNIFGSKLPQNDTLYHADISSLLPNVSTPPCNSHNELSLCGAFGGIQSTYGQGEIYPKQVGRKRSLQEYEALNQTNGWDSAEIGNHTYSALPTLPQSFGLSASVMGKSVSPTFPRTTNNRVGEHRIGIIPSSPETQASSSDLDDEKEDDMPVLPDMRTSRGATTVIHGVTTDPHDIFVAAFIDDVIIKTTSKRMRLD